MTFEAICCETGAVVEFRSPDDDYRTDARWRHTDDSACNHKIHRLPGGNSEHVFGTITGKSR